ncbi:MAG: hypothetical protein LDLANPLL_00023 [Turneriella sp.]|nr:hypothetical protein [Turneriella sp.]
MTTATAQSFTTGIWDGTAFQPATVSVTSAWSTNAYLNDTLTLSLSWVRFPENSQIQWTLATTNITDDSGNALAASVVQTFTTGWVTPAFAWADTGQTGCYYYDGTAWTADSACLQSYAVGNTSYPQGEDAHYADKPQARSYTASSPGGNDIVTDNVTGLVWKTCSEGQTGSNCQGSGNSGNNYNATTMSWYAAMNQCAALNAASYAGRTDWRLPTSMELETLPNLGTSSPAIDVAYFPATVYSSYWSSSTYASNVSTAWNVSFTSGNSFSSSKTTNLYVRCVSSGPSFVAVPYTDNGDGTVTDSRTNLRWQKCSNNLSGTSCSSGTATQLSWVNAIAYCESLNLGSFGNSTAWRLPSKNELVSIVDRSRSSPAIDTAAFPATVPGLYWSSSTYVSSVSNAWNVNFDYGNTLSNAKTASTSVRCVSDGP